jgi:D-beta-D-heptose 7-phosphate kinase/D-beta-D-heptose 1-phosphate adenosyltransferase
LGRVIAENSIGFVGDCLNHIGYYGAVPVKHRFLDGSVQVRRWDIESPNCGLSEDRLAEIQSKIVMQMRTRRPEVVILSDYNKGIFNSSDINWPECFPHAITIVDPKCAPLNRWKGCTIFKPNAKEAREISGKKTWREQAKYFQNQLGCESVVITFGGEKVCGVWRDDFFIYKPDKTVDAESVVGAGDCFCAFFAMAVGRGLTVPEASIVAWNAGAVYVQNKMNRPITAAELSPDGIVEAEDLTLRDFSLVLTNGCFDLLHRGHLHSLREAKKHGDKLAVAVNSDESVRKLKGEGRPVKPLEDRMAVLAALDMVDFVVPFHEDDPYEILKKIVPDVLAKGEEYRNQKVIGEDLVKKVVYTSMLPGLSTTNFVNKKSGPKAAGD